MYKLVDHVDLYKHETFLIFERLLNKVILFVKCRYTEIINAYDLSGS